MSGRGGLFLMAKGFNVKQPLALDDSAGTFQLTTELQETISQNLKFLVLTKPGERIAVPDFGVGIENYLFEQSTPAIQNLIRQNIIEQANTYMPYITIREINFETNPENIDNSLLSFSISYFTNDTATVDGVLVINVPDALAGVTVL